MSEALTAEAAVATLSMLALRYSPRPMPWTDNAADPATRRATMLAWVEQMQQYPAAAVLAAAEQVCTDHPEWTPNLNEFTAAMQVQARRQAADSQRQRSLQAAYRCDGSGWIDRHGDGHLQPCPRCNPFLHSEWRAGRLSDHGPQREDRRKAWLNENGGMPTPCLPPTDTGLASPPVEGLATAWRAYAAEAEAAGRKPDPQAFGRWAR